MQYHLHPLHDLKVNVTVLEVLCKKNVNLDRFGNKKSPYSVMLILTQFFSLLFNIVYCRVTDSEF